MMMLIWWVAAPGSSPEVVPLREVGRTLLEENEGERLYSLRLQDERGRTVDAFYRLPAHAADGPVPVVVLAAGRFTGRQAAALIPGPLETAMLAVEYPQTFPPRIAAWEWIRALPAIRRSARQMPGLLRGAAHHLAAQPEIDASRIGLVGVSFGVPFAAVAGRDRIFSGVALHYGGANLASLFQANLPMRDGLGRNALAGFAGWWFKEMDPGRHIAAISPTPLLLINATLDEQIPRESALLLAEGARDPVRQIWLPYGHLTSTEPEVIREVADSTFRWFGFHE
jgi:poly(3-hydroxybutyrate) depolymerase